MGSRYNGGGGGGWGDHGGGGGGGGFVAGEGSASQSPGKGSKDFPEQSLRPVTIRQLVDAAEDSSNNSTFTLTGQELGQITFVGMVRSVNKTETNVFYTFEDGTGSIEGRQWTNKSSLLDDDMNDENQQQKSDDHKQSGSSNDKISENEWVQVFGLFKTFGNKRYVNIMKLFKIQDFNQVTFHFLESIRVTLFFERGPPNGNQKYQQSNDTSAYSMSESRSNNPYSTTNTITNTGGGGGGGASNYSHLPPLQQSIMKIILERINDVGSDGVAIQHIVKNSKASQSDIARQCELLVEEGNLYTTISDEHFMPTES